MWSRLKIFCLLILYLSIFPSACYTENYHENTSIEEGNDEIPVNEEIPINEEMPIYEEIPITVPKPSSNNIDIKIGQMLMVGFRGLYVNNTSHIVQDIKKYHLGGVILFDYDTPSRKPIRNIKSPKQLKKLIQDLQVVSSIPLFVAIDQEGGRIARLKKKFGFPPTVSAQHLGTKNNSDFTYKEAEKIAKTLASVGINFNFAPVVDLNINPNNPVIGRLRRSFSYNPRIVTRHALQFIKAHHKYNIITILKHFPGHGSSTADSHLRWVDVSNTWMEMELDPYRNIINANQADAIMIAHVFNDILDSKYPATLSKNVVTDLLRRELGYQGVVVSDDMQMEAVAKHYQFKEAIFRTIQAGIDIIVIGNNLKYEPNIASRTVSVIKELIWEGKITEKRIDESYQRIQKLKNIWIPKRYKQAVTPSNNKTDYYPQHFNIIQNKYIEKPIALKPKTGISPYNKNRNYCLSSEIKLTIRNSQNLGQHDRIICLDKGEYKLFVTYPDGKESEEFILNQ